nr:C2H2-type zinc finger protein [Rhodococcus sp. (in: high G+C Gram-positive bacteria)]
MTDISTDKQKPADPFQCKDCAYIGTSIQALRMHQMGKHSKPKMCQVCKQEFKTPASLASHMKSHGPKVEKGEPVSTIPPVKDGIIAEKKKAGRPRKAAAKQVPPRKAPAKVVAATRTPRGNSRVIDVPVDYSSLSNEQLMAKLPDAMSLIEEVRQRFGDLDTKLTMIREATSL